MTECEVDLVDHAAEIMKLIADGTRPGRAVMEAVRERIFYDHHEPSEESDSQIA